MHVKMEHRTPNRDDYLDIRGEGSDLEPAGRSWAGADICLAYTHLHRPSLKHDKRKLDWVVHTRGGRDQSFENELIRGEKWVRNGKQDGI